MVFIYLLLCRYCFFSVSKQKNQQREWQWLVTAAGSARVATTAPREMR